MPVAVPSRSTRYPGRGPRSFSAYGRVKPVPTRPRDEHRPANLKLAQMLAGHADIGTTANIYAHLDTTDLEAALRALEAED